MVALLNWRRNKSKSVDTEQGSGSLTPMTQVSLTSEAKAKHEKLMFPKPHSSVVAVLYEHGSSSIAEIASHANMHPKKVSDSIVVLKRNGYVRVLNGAES